MISTRSSLLWAMILGLGLSVNSGFLGKSAFSADFDPDSDKNDPNSLQERGGRRRPLGLSERIVSLIESGKYKKHRAMLLQEGITRCISDRSGLPRVVGREKEIQEMLKTLLRFKGQTLLILGEPGVGKTALVEGLAQVLRRTSENEWPVLRELFPNSTKIIETNSNQLSVFAQKVQMPYPHLAGTALEMFFEEARELQTVLESPIIVFIDDFHTLNEYQLLALKAEMNRPDGVRLILASDFNSFQRIVKNDVALESKLSRISLEEISVEETLTALKKGWTKFLGRRYYVQMDEAALLAAIRVSTEIYPERKRPDAPIRFLQDLAISVGFDKKPSAQKMATITESDVHQFASAIAKLPINPSDSKALVNYVEGGRAEIKKRIIGQDAVVDGLVDTWQSILMADPARASRSVAILGTTGTGKTYAAEMLADVFLDGRDRILTIEANTYQDEYSLFSLLGAPNGVLSSDKTRGILPEYLSGRGKGSGMIIINEFEKAHPNFAKRIMEMLEKSQLTAGDGKVDHLGRHLIVFTSNRGADRIFTAHSGLASPEEMIQKISSYTEADIKQFFTESRGYAADDKSKLPPEVVNRINRWMVAKPLFLNEAMQIADLQVKKFVLRSAKRHGLELLVQPEVTQWLTRSSYTLADGARVIANRVDSILTQALAEVWKKVDSTRGAKIEIRLGGTTEVPSLVLVDLTQQPSGTKLAEVAFPSPPEFMALSDPRFIDLLRTLEEKVKSEIQGQDDVISKMASYTRMRAMRPLDPRPMVYGFFGPTGTGKTELAKVYAKYLYGSYERAHVFEFGKIQNRHDLANFFNPPKGIVGSESASPFQVLIESFPEGGVVVFDEMWNMGRSASQAEREALFQYFYTLFDEGKWTNEHGKTYDLSKWTIILTGNAGEKDFQDAPSDDLKESVWKSLNHRHKLKKILMEGGLPEAFVNRISEIVLFKPLSAASRLKVQNKFIRQIVDPIASANGIKLEFSPEFYEQASRLFFPVDDGARGNRRFVENDLASFVTDMVFQNLEAIQNAKSQGYEPQIRISLRHNFPENAWAVAPEQAQETFRVEFVAQLRIDPAGQQNPVEFVREVKPTSAPRVDIRTNALRVAAHEAGHALVNEHLGEPAGRVSFMTIESAGEYGGYCRYDDEFRNFSNYSGDLASYLRRMAVSAAGYRGQSAVGFERDWGWSSDLSNMRAQAIDAIIKGGLIEGFEFIPTHSSAEPYLDEYTRAKVTEMAQLMVDASIELAQKILEEPNVKLQLEKLSSALVEQGHLTGEEYRQVVGEHRIAEKTWLGWTAQAVQNIQKAAKKPSTTGCGSLLDS